MFNRAVLHLDLDAFFVSVERLKNSALEGQPLIIGGSSERGVVASCSYEARKYGIHSAMPIKMALRLCPDAKVIRGDMEAYAQQSDIITEIIEAEVPLFEKASIDEFYIDLTGMDKYVGCWNWSAAFRQKIIRETGLPISCGLSINKLVSKVGTSEAKPNGAQLIKTGTEKIFLAPLSVAKLPSLGKVTYKKLRFMGVRTIQTLSEIPPRLLQREFGKNGVALWKKANAIDDSPIIPHSERKSISTERTFQVDTINIQSLKSQLTAMVMQLAYDLRTDQKLTACITVKIRYSDFNTYSRQKRIPFTASDQNLIHYAHGLFDKLYERRQLVRLVGVRLSHLVHGNTQMNLFDDSSEEASLLKALDGIRNRFGLHTIKRGNQL